METTRSDDEKRLMWSDGHIILLCALMKVCLHVCVEGYDEALPVPAGGHKHRRSDVQHAADCLC